MTAGPINPPPPPRAPAAPGTDATTPSTGARSSPYKGLAPYEDTDAKWFFGRERARQVVAANLMSERLTVVYGESGVGKSSLLRAGVAHHLRAESRRNLAELGTPEFLVVDVATWQDDPKATVHRAMARAVHDLVGPGSPLPDVVDGSLAETIKSWSRSLDVDFLFIFDQFEECFLYHDDTDPFLQQLPEVVNRDDLRANFILALREDRLAQLDRLKSRLDTNLFANRLRVGHLDRAAAREAILGPLALHNEVHGTAVSMDDELVELVLDQVTRGRVSALGDVGLGRDDGDDGHVETPFLQLVLTRLWETAVPATGPDRAAHTISVATLQSLGGAEAIVRNHLDGAMAALSESERAVAADAFRFLVTPGGSKIALGADDLASFTSHSSDELKGVLESLSAGSMSILRTVEPPPGETRRRYEIFHDVLAPAVTEWRQRVEEQRAAGERERQLTAQVGRWRRRVAMATAAALAVGVAASLVVFSINNARDADHQRLLSTARAAADPQLALAAALEAAELSSTPESMELLRHVLSDVHPSAIVDDHDRTVRSAAYRPDGGQVVTAGADSTALLLDPATGDVDTVLEGHGDQVIGARYTPDGSRVVTWSLDGTARLWDLATGAQEHVLTHGPHPVSIQLSDTASADGGAVVSPFSADGQLLVTSAGGVAWLWDLGSGELVRTMPDLLGRPELPDALPSPLDLEALSDLDLSGETTSSTAPVFTADGTILTGGSDGIARRFDADTGEVVATYGQGDHGLATHAMADPSGRFVAVAHDGGWTVLYDHETEEEVASWFSQADDLTGMAFTPSGQRLVTSGDTSVNAWATDPPNVVSRYDSLYYVVTMAASPDGRALAATLSNGTVVVIDPGTGTVDAELVGHTNVVWSAGFAPDGRAVVTGGEDATVRLWPLPRGLDLDVSEGYLAPAAFDADGGRLVIAGRDGVAQVHDAATGEVLQEFVGDVPTDGDGVFPIETADLDTTGERAVTVQSTGTILFDAATGQRLRTCCVRDGWEPWAGGFLLEPADHLLVAYVDDTITIWEVDEDGETPVHTFDNAVTLAASSDGEVFVTQGRGQGASPGNIMIWDRDGTTFTRTAEWRTQLLAWTAMSPDGTTVATVGFDGSVTTWDSDGDRRFTITGQDATAAAFTGDGNRLVVGTADGRVGSWSVENGRFLGEVHAHPLAVGTLSVADDGRVASSGLEGTVRVMTCNLCDLTDEDVIDLARERLLDPPS